MAEAADAFLNFKTMWPRFGPGRAVRTSRLKTKASKDGEEVEKGYFGKCEQNGQESGVNSTQPFIDDRVDPSKAILRRFPLLHVLPFRSVMAQHYGGGDYGKGEILHRSPLCGGVKPVSNKIGRESKGGEGLSTSTTPSWSADDGRFSVISVRLGASCDDENTLRSLIWGGCRPEVLRPAAWRLLLGYTPPSIGRQHNELMRKRMIYEEYIRQYIQLSEVDDYIMSISAQSIYSSSAIPKRNLASSELDDNSLSSLFHFPVTTSRGTTLIAHEKAIISQIALDLPRHRASVYHCSRTVASMARSLFLWSQRHPAVGYVQGMDDILGVFFQIFLASGLRQREAERNAQAREESSGSEPMTSGADEKGYEVLQALMLSNITEQSLQGWEADTLDAALQDLPEKYLLQIEADTYWCTDRVLSLLQDNYVSGQTGLIKCAMRLEAIVSKADPTLITFINESGVRLFDSCFQWMHCLLVRELPLPLLLRLWDTYFAVGDDNLLQFHIYICAALVLNLRSALLGSPMDTVMLILKNPFEYAKFPVFTSSSLPRSEKLVEEDARRSPIAEKPPELVQGKRSSHGGSTAPMGFVEPPEGESLWLEMLIADAYRLWRQYPSL